MSYLVRRLLLFGIIFLFIIIAPLICLYAQGYRINWDNLEFTKTGTISIKTIPRGTTIYLNNKKVKSVSPTKIDELKPKVYSLKIEKPGYKIWEANLTVNPELVTSVTHVVLIPENPMIKNLVPYEVENFSLSSDNQKIVYSVDKGEETGTWIYDTNNNQSKRVTKTYFNEFTWSSDNSSLILIQNSGSVKNWGLLKFNNNNNYQISDLGNILNAPIQKLDWRLGSNQKLFALDQNNNLYEVNLAKLSRSLIQKNVYAYAQTNNGVMMILENNGLYALVSQDFQLSNDLKTLSPLPPRDYYKILPGSKKIAVLAGKSLYLIQDNLVQKIADEVVDASWSPDGKRLLNFNEHEIDVYYLKNETNVILTRDSRSLKNISWWPRSQYAIFTVTGKIKLIDAAPEMNTHNITEIMDTRMLDTKMIWSQNTKNLFVLAENQNQEIGIFDLRLIEE